MIRVQFTKGKTVYDGRLHKWVVLTQYHINHDSGYPIHDEVHAIIEVDKEGSIEVIPAKEVSVIREEGK